MGEPLFSLGLSLRGAVVGCVYSQHHLPLDLHNPSLTLSHTSCTPLGCRLCTSTCCSPTPHTSLVFHDTSPQTSIVIMQGKCEADSFCHYQEGLFRSTGGLIDDTSCSRCHHSFVQHAVEAAEPLGARMGEPVINNSECYGGSVG